MELDERTEGIVIEFPDEAMYYRWNSAGFGQVFVNGNRKERVHVWSTNYRNTRDDLPGIHDHRFTFDSTILLGVLRWVEYRVELNGEGPYMLLEVGGNPLGLCRVIRIAEHTMHKGETYSFGGPGRYHEVLAPTEDTMTHVVETGGRPYRPRLVMPNGIVFDRETFNLKGRTRSEVLHEVNRLRKQL